MWRSSGDIGSSWDRVLKNLDTLVGNGDKGQPGRWNDPGTPAKNVSFYTSKSILY